MISRVAESCFWLNRYLERVDTFARLLEVTSSYSLDVKLESGGRWRPIIIVLGMQDDFLERHGEALFEDAKVVQHYLVWDKDNPFSIYSSMKMARENARTVREVISVPMWETLNEFWLWLNSRSAKRLYDKERDAFYEQVGARILTFHGTCFSTMLHEKPYYFVALGRALERANQSARLLDIRHHALRDFDEESGEDDEGIERPIERNESAIDAAQWIMILRSCAAEEPFFRRPTNVLRGSSVADFVLFEFAFPRSVAHNLETSRSILTRLLDDAEPGYSSPSINAVERLLGSLVQMAIDDVRNKGLHETLTWLVGDLGALCDTIHQEFFDSSVGTSRARALRQLGSFSAQQQV